MIASVLQDPLPGYEGALLGSITPFTALAQITVALLLGLLIASQGKFSRWEVPVAFVVGVTGGVILYFVRNRWLIQYARDAVAVGMLVAGLAAILLRSWPRAVIIAVIPIVVACGVGSGYLVAIDIPSEGRHFTYASLYTIGYLTTALILMGITAVVAEALKTRPRMRLYLRLATIVLLVVGVYFLLDAISCRSNVFCPPFLEREMFTVFGS
ncbi:MAG: HupE/UreJ family protein [Chloroflexota bacterium]